jgi:hypothetical protein
MAWDDDAPIPTPADCAPAPVVPCPDPPLPQAAPIALVDKCAPDGRAIFLVYQPGAPDNGPCPPVAGTPPVPGYLGWIDVTADPNILIAGAPPFVVSDCAGRMDTELGGVWCVVDDITGAEVAPFNVVWEVTRDSVTGAILAARWVTPDTAVTFVPPPGITVRRCTQKSATPITVCDTATATPFVRWFASDTRTVIADTTADGTTYTPVGVVVVGECPCTTEPPIGVITDLNLL